MWHKIGRILKPNRNIPWLYRWSSATCLESTVINDPNPRLYITGREKNGASRIGTATLHLETLTVSGIAKTPLFPLGTPGTFDEHGTSYPAVVKGKNGYSLFYSGWTRGKTIPWYNALGCVTSKDGVHFAKKNFAPVFDRNFQDPIGIGSTCILKENNVWKAWYTSFSEWRKIGKEFKHFYRIRYATSKDGISWTPSGKTCIDFSNTNEYAISTPSVLHIGNSYLMWYSYRGETYRIGFATSLDGIHWKRRDKEGGLLPSPIGWDSKMVCYPFVFIHNDMVYMLYNGNGFGQSGLGIASMKRTDLMSLI